MNIVILGKPGSGKGSVAAKLVAAFGLQHLSTGDILRREIAAGTELGIYAKQLIDQGNFVPDEVATAMIKNSLEHTSDGLIFDGFPRSIPQAFVLDELVDKGIITIDHYIYLDIDDTLVIDRITQRQVCNSCSATYHMTNFPSQINGICDHCGGELLTRKDDNLEKIKYRLGIFDEFTKPVIEYYDQQDSLITVDASRDLDIVYNDVVKGLEL
jgi:adenylate kinase